MDKLLPTIEIQKPQTNLPEPAPEGAKLPETDNMDLMDDIVSQSEDKPDDRDIINIEEREIPDEDEVFLADSKERTPQKIAPVIEDNQQTNLETPSEFPEKRTKRKYVRKAPMSDKQRNHLAKMREIASEKRRLERERKAKEKEEAIVAKAEKKILEKKKKEEEDSLKIQRAEQDKINNPPPRGQVPEKVNGFTKEDLDSAVLSAISQYDTLRKQQKKEKREAEKKRAEEDKMKATLARAINPRPAPNDPWRNFFT